MCFEYSSAVFMLAKIEKQIRLLTKNICQSVFVKRFYFPIFYNIFSYTQLAFVFHLQEEFCIFRDQIFCFLFFFYSEDS